MTRKIFISHRHDDADIAKVLAEHLDYWGISSAEVFQTSSAAGGGAIGDHLVDALKQAVSEAKLPNQRHWAESVL